MAFVCSTRCFYRKVKSKTFVAIYSDVKRLASINQNSSLVCGFRAKLLQNILYFGLNHE